MVPEDENRHDFIHSTAHSRFVLAVYIITFVTGAPANILALYTFIKTMKKKVTPINILLLNLTISDLLFLIVLPFKMQEAVDHLTWRLPPFLCPLTHYVFFVTIYNSTLFLTAISVERYLGVAYPIKYKLKRQPWHAIVASLFSWVFSMAHCSIIYALKHFDLSKNCTMLEKEEYYGPECYENFSKEQLQILMPVRLELFLVLFCVPLLICSFCYINFVRILSQRSNINSKKRFRAIGLALGTLLLFIVCFAPYSISHIVGFVTWQSPKWRVDALLSSTLNACLDPLILYCSSSAFRGTTKVLLKRMVGR